MISEILYVFLDDLANVTISSNAPLVNDQITWQLIKTDTQRKSLIPTFAKDAKNAASSKPLINIHKNNDEAEDMYAPKDMYVLYFEESQLWETINAL